VPALGDGHMRQIGFFVDHAIQDGTAILASLRLFS
jgi:hypothetical protein